MRVLIVSFYYPPDLSAGSFRTGALVKRLLQKLGPEDTVHVLTTAPNRYSTFQSDAPKDESQDRLTIERIELSAHEGGLKDQLVAFFGFARQVLKGVASERADVVYATSSRLGTAALGALVARRLRARLHLDIRDLFPENMSNMLRGPTRMLVPVLGFLEKWALRAADQISIVSPGFHDYVMARKPRSVPLLRTNGIDEEFLGPDFKGGGGQPPVILYAGNIGDGQGLSRVVPEAARLLHCRFRFRIIGDGGRRSELEREISSLEQRLGHKLDIEIMAPMKRAQLIEQYTLADVLLVHLNDYPAFRLVIPSKLFEYGATGKPILAGLAGVSADFVLQHIENAFLFEPCDAEGLAVGVDRLTIGHTERAEFIDKFNRTNILDCLADDIIALGQRTSSDEDHSDRCKLLHRAPKATDHRHLFPYVS